MGPSAAPRSQGSAGAGVSRSRGQAAPGVARPEQGCGPHRGSLRCPLLVAVGIVVGRPVKRPRPSCHRPPYLFSCSINVSEAPTAAKHCAPSGDMTVSLKYTCPSGTPRPPLVFPPEPQTLKPPARPLERTQLQCRTSQGRHVHPQCCRKGCWPAFVPKPRTQQSAFHMTRSFSSLQENSVATQHFEVFIINLF